MKLHRADQPFAMVDGNGAYTAEFEVRFAAYVASIESSVDDPSLGKDCRELLELDRDELRAWYALTLDLKNVRPAPMTTVFATVLVAVQLVVVVLIIWVSL